MASKTREERLNQRRSTTYKRHRSTPTGRMLLLKEPCRHSLTAIPLPILTICCTNSSKWLHRAAENGSEKEEDPNNLKKRRRKAGWPKTMCSIPIPQPRLQPISLLSIPKTTSTAISSKFSNSNKRVASASAPERSDSAP